MLSGCAEDEASAIGASDMVEDEKVGKRKRKTGEEYALLEAEDKKKASIANLRRRSWVTWRSGTGGGATLLLEGAGATQIVSCVE